MGEAPVSADPSRPGGTCEGHRHSLPYSLPESVGFLKKKPSRVLKFFPPLQPFPSQAAG